eukprot:m.234606 g.234606  ORF g.234606 m.234606 type:complete len:152 (-) comp18916_c5_seq5:615-1070(-)
MLSACRAAKRALSATPPSPTSTVVPRLVFNCCVVAAATSATACSSIASRSLVTSTGATMADQDLSTGCQTPADWTPVDGKLPVMGSESLMVGQKVSTTTVLGWGSSKLASAVGLPLCQFFIFYFSVCLPLAEQKGAWHKQNPRSVQPALWM